MKVNRLPSLSLLRTRLRLDPKTGFLYWRERSPAEFYRRQDAATWNAKHAGKRAGAEKGRGYRTVRINGISYHEHRIAYALHYGKDPGRLHVDHADGPSNKPSNLSLLTNQQNVRRRVRMNANNTSGVHGVYWSKASGKWVASIQTAGAKIHLGVFSSLEAAAAARRKAEVQHYGEVTPASKRRKA